MATRKQMEEEVRRRLGLSSSSFSANRTQEKRVTPSTQTVGGVALTRRQMEEEVSRRASQYRTYDTADGKRDFLDKIAERTSGIRQNRYDRQARRSQAYRTGLRLLQEREDFDELAERGRRRAARGAFDRTTARDHSKSREEQGVMNQSKVDEAFDQNIYDFMTPEQRNVYYAFLGSGDRAGANNYLNSIEEGLQRQAAQKLSAAADFTDVASFEDFMNVSRLGVRSGVGRFTTGVEQLGKPDAVAKDYTELVFEEARPYMDKGTGILADLSNTVGFMLLPIGGSIVLGAVGAAGAGAQALSASLFGAASGGSTYNDLLRENPEVDKFDAKVYAIVNGALEGGLQFALGGIQALGGGGLARAGVTRALTARLNNVAKAAANTPAVKTLMRGLLAGGRYAAGAADEAVEEWLQAVLDPVVRNHILGEDNEVKLFDEEQLYAAMLGAMGAAVMNAPNIGANYRSADVTVRQALDDAVRKATPAAPVESPAASPAESPAESPVSPAPASQQQIDAVAIRDLTAEISRLETVLLTAKPRHRAAVQRALAARQTQLQQLLLGQNVTPQTQGNEPAVSNEDLQDLTPADDIEATRTEAENQIRDEIEAAIENLSQPEEEAAPAALPEVSTPAVEADLQAQINQEVQTILEAASRGEIDTNEAVDAIVDLVNANREGLENGGHAYSIPGRQSENGVRGRMEPLYGLSETGRTVQNYEEGGAAAAGERGQLYREGIDDGEQMGFGRDYLRPATNRENGSYDTGAIRSLSETGREGTGERGQLYREGIDNAEGLQRFAHTDGAPEWGSRNDDGRRGSSLQEMAGQVLRGEGTGERGQLHGLTEDKRIPKEDLNNGKDQLTASGDIAFRKAANGEDSGPDIGGMEGLYGEERGANGQQRLQGDAFWRNEQIKNMYTSRSGGIKHVDASIISPDFAGKKIYTLEEQDVKSLLSDTNNASKWQVLRDAIEQFEAEVVGSSQRPDFRFFAGDEQVDDLGFCVFDLSSGMCTIWVNISTNNPINTTVRHEYFHFKIRSEAGLYDFTLEEMRKAGLDDVQIEDLVYNYIAPTWNFYYGNPDEQNAYTRYVVELMCELYGRDTDVAAKIGETLNNAITFDGDGRQTTLLEKDYDGSVERAAARWQNAVIYAAIKYQFSPNVSKVDNAQGASDNGSAFSSASRKSGALREGLSGPIDSGPGNSVERTLNTENTPNGEGIFYSPEREHSTITNAEKDIPEVQEVLEEVPEESRTYETVSEDETNAQANEWIRKKGGSEAAFTSLMNTRNWTPQHMTAAISLFSGLAQSGDTTSAKALCVKILNQAPDFGRAINFFKTLQRYMPHGVVALATSVANELDVELTAAERADIDLIDRMIEDGYISNSVLEAASPGLRSWLEEAQPYIDTGQLDPGIGGFAAALRLVMSKKPASARERFRALQRISLLSNPKTHVRNILGNVVEQFGAVMSRPMAVATDRLISKRTGQRTFGAGGGHAFVTATADSIGRAVMDYRLGLNTIDNKFNESTRKGMQQIVQQKAFNEETDKTMLRGINKTLNAIDRVIGLGLAAGDAPFLIGTYEAALAQMMTSNNVTEATAEMIDAAWQAAYRRTFRDSNAVTKALNQVRDSLPFVGETIAPYVQTPVNVVLVSIQYSPIGFAEAFMKAVVGKNSLEAQIKRGESTLNTQRQIAELIGRGSLGTACILLGSLLASAGRITGDDDDIDSSREKNWNRAIGRRGNAIKVGDKYSDPSSIQSLSSPVMAGAAAWHSRQETGEADLGAILKAATMASLKLGNTVLEMPVLQGVADLFGGYYDKGELLAGVLSLAGDAATQIVPFGSLARQAAKAVDPYSRTQTEINVNEAARIGKNVVNDLRTMTPGGRRKLPPRYDVLGQPMKNDASTNVAGRIYNSFFNPFNTSRAVSNEVTDEIDRLFESLQDPEVLPTAAGNSVSFGGTRYKFTSADKQEYQRIEGETTSEIISSLVNSYVYSRLSDEQRKEVLTSVYSYASEQAKKAYFEGQGVEYDATPGWMAKIDRLVESGIDIGDAIVHYNQMKNIDGSDNQVAYVNKQNLTKGQKTALDNAFVDKFATHPIDEVRDYTNNNTLALSMTSETGMKKYDARFSQQWTGRSGNTYDGLTGVQFADFYDAYHEGSNVEERVAAIQQMLMSKYFLDEDEAYEWAADFRYLYAKQLK